MRKIALLVGLLFLLASCSSLAKLNELGEDLVNDGYQVANLNHNTSSSGSVLSVEIVEPGAVPTEDDAVGVAEVVWNRYEDDFDTLEVVVNAQPMLRASTEELTERFGERPAGLTDGNGGGGGMNVTALVVILAIAAAFAGLMVWLWRRGRRPPPPVAPPGPAPGYYAANPYATPPPEQHYPS